MKEKKRDRELWNEGEEKWTTWAVAGIYTAILLTASPMDYLNNIIFNYSVDEFSNVCQ